MNSLALLSRKTRWPVAELVFWAFAAASFFLLPRSHLILNEIAILALFALSLDLVLGYAGIASLGHAAFFGAGAYCVGLLAKYDYVSDPLLGLAAAAAVGGGLGYATSFLVLRGADLTRLMVTLGIALVLAEIANKWADVTGGADGLTGFAIGPLLGLFEFDLFGEVAYAYSLTVLFVLVALARLVVRSPFGVSLKAIRDNRLRAAAIGIPVHRRLSAVYALGAAYAAVAGGLLTQTSQIVSLDVLEFHRSADVLLVLIIGGTGYLYGGILGAIAFRLLQDWLAVLTPEYWQFWIGALLVIVVLVGRARIDAGLLRVTAALHSRGGDRPL